MTFGTKALLALLAIITADLTVLALHGVTSEARAQPTQWPPGVIACGPTGQDCVLRVSEVPLDRRD